IAAGWRRDSRDAGKIVRGIGTSTGAGSAGAIICSRRWGSRANPRREATIPPIERSDSTGPRFATSRSARPTFRAAVAFVVRAALIDHAPHVVVTLCEILGAAFRTHDLEHDGGRYAERPAPESLRRPVRGWCR